MPSILKRLALVAALLATLVGLSGPASADASPNLFDLDTQPVATVDPQKAEFRGTVTASLATSDNASDKVKIRVEGELIAYSSECYRLRVEYLDANGALVAAEHSGFVYNPGPGSSAAIPVIESSKSQQYRNARLVIERGPTCTTLAPFKKVTTDLDLPVAGLGARSLEIPVAQHRVSIDENGGMLDGQLTLSVVTNPPGIADRGVARLTGTMGHNDFGCVRTLLQGRDADDGFLGTRYSDLECSNNAVSVGQDLWFNDPDLHRIDVLLYAYDSNGSGYSPREIFILD